jgi:Fe-S-cluster formation regulator IscX/YfhJ
MVASRVSQTLEETIPLIPKKVRWADIKKRIIKLEKPYVMRLKN